MRLYILDVVFYWFVCYAWWTSGSCRASSLLIWDNKYAVSKDLTPSTKYVFCLLAHPWEIIPVYRWSDIKVSNLQGWPFCCRHAATNRAIFLTLYPWINACWGKTVGGLVIKTQTCPLIAWFVIKWSPSQGFGSTRVNISPVCFGEEKVGVYSPAKKLLIHRR